MSSADVFGFVELEKQITKLNKKIDSISRSTASIETQTTPTIPLIPSLVIAFTLVYPVQSVILETAKDHKFSAWASGYLLDLQQFTAKQGLKIGIQSVGGSTEYTKPLAKKLVVTSRFGTRKHPITGKIKQHNGIDYRCKKGDPVYAVQSGVVKWSGTKGKAGKMVVIEHSTGEKSVYMHLNSISVKNNERLANGEKIGGCGSTGSSTAPHLHLEIITAKGKRVNPVHVVGITQSADMWEYFKDTVAESESTSSGGYKAVSKSGTFKGRYQMDRATINYAGYKHVSLSKFMKTPSLQDEIYRSWQAKNVALFRSGSYICESRSGKLKLAFSKKTCDRKKGVWSYLNGFINDGTPAYIVAGALHAAQFGPKNALRWYSRKVDFRDGNKVKISTYAERGENAFKSKYGRFASAGPLLKAIEK